MLSSNSAASLEELLRPPRAERKSLLAEVLSPLDACSIATQEPPTDPIVVKLNVIPARVAEASRRLGRPRKRRSRSGASGLAARNNSASNGNGLQVPLPKRRQGEPEEDYGLWNVKAVCEYLKCSKSWVYKAAELGELPCVRIRSMLRFHPAGVRAFVFGEGN